MIVCYFFLIPAQLTDRGFAWYGGVPAELADIPEILTTYVREVTIAHRKWNSKAFVFTTRPSLYAFHFFYMFLVRQLRQL